MNIKKIAVTAIAGATMFASAMPAAAAVNVGFGNGNIAQTNMGGAVNVTRTSASTGGNANVALISGAQLITTGTAASAANVQNQVNYNQITCGCVSGNFNLGLANGNVAQTNVGTALNVTNTSANTGRNANVAAGALLQGTQTGGASAGTVVVNAVNTNVIGGAL